jgi:hypothetical protein
MSNYLKEMNLKKKHLKKQILDWINVVVFMKKMVMYDVYLSFDDMIVMNKVVLKKIFESTESKN